MIAKTMLKHIARIVTGAILLILISIVINKSKYIGIRSLPLESHKNRISAEETSFSSSGNVTVTNPLQNTTQFRNKTSNNSMSQAADQLFTDNLQNVYDCVSGAVIGFKPSGSDVVTSLLHTATYDTMSARRQADFQDIFRQGGWPVKHTDYKGLQVSGPGSTLTFAQDIIATLHMVITYIKHKHKKSVVRLLDVPCGDMQWMSTFLHTRSDVSYTGMDIVPELIAHHKKLYKQQPWEFIHGDIVNTEMEPYDLILSRMMMQHLTHSDVINTLSKLSESGSKYALMTTFASMEKNTDVDPNNKWAFRPLNLEIPPFKLTPPLCYNRDGPNRKFGDHFVGLWKLPLVKINECSQIYLNSLNLTETQAIVYSCLQLK